MVQNNIYKYYFTEFTDYEKNIIVKVTGDTVNDSFRYHTHDFNELVIISGGIGIHIVGDKEYVLKKGDVFFVHSSAKHSYKKCNKLIITNIMFKDDAIYPYLDILKTLSGFVTLFRSTIYQGDMVNDIKHITLTDNDINHINLLIESIKACGDNMEPGYELETVSVFLKILIYLSRIYVYYNSQIDISTTNIARSLSYIENNYLEEISIDKLASMVCMSKRNYFRLFNKHFNTTPYDYIIKLRISYSVYLLKNTDMTISEISNLSKFNDSNYYTRCFNKTMGLSPSKFKQKNQT